MFARFQHRRRKFGMIYRVGEVLRLKADGVAFAVNSAVFADSLGENSRGIKLHSLKRGSHLKLYAAGFGNQNRSGGITFIQHKIVVKAAGGGKLGKGKAVAKQSSVSEIEGGAIDRSDLAGGNIAAIGRGEAVGVDGKQMVGYFAMVMPRKIEICVVGEVDHRIFGRNGMKINGQLAVFESIADLGAKLAGKSLVAVGRNVGEGHAVSVTGIGPQLFVEAFVSSVQHIFALVCGDAVFGFAYAEACAANSIGTASDGAAEAGIERLILLKTVIAEADIGGVSVFIGDCDGAYRRSVGDKLDRDAAFGDDQQRNVNALDRAERFDFYHYLSS